MARINPLELCRLIRADGFRPRSYSGRGMYGAECIGAGADSVEAGRLLTLAPGGITDSMGRGVIVYWPSVKWTRECEKHYPEES